MAKPCTSPTNAGDVAVLTPQKIRLNSADDVRLEMARVYRDMRGGSLDTKKGCSFIYALGQIGKMIEVSIVEKRLDQLERTVEGGNGSERY